jgi:hypothetical protein
MTIKEQNCNFLQSLQLILLVAMLMRFSEVKQLSGKVQNLAFFFDLSWRYGIVLQSITPILAKTFFSFHFLSYLEPWH